MGRNQKVERVMVSALWLAALVATVYASVAASDALYGIGMALVFTVALGIYLLEWSNRDTHEWGGTSEGARRHAQTGNADQNGFSLLLSVPVGFAADCM